MTYEPQRGSFGKLLESKKSDLRLRCDVFAPPTVGLWAMVDRVPKANRERKRRQSLQSELLWTRWQLGHETFKSGRGLSASMSQ